MAREKMTGVRFSEKERKWLEAKSLEEEISITTIIRQLVKAAMKKESK